MPEGTTPEGTTPEGTTPEGAAPEGTAPTIDYSELTDEESLDEAAAELELDAEPVTISFAGSTATAEEGYKFKGWFLDETPVSESETFVPADAGDTQVVHVDDSGDASVFGASIEGSSAEFSSDEFSVYGIAITEEEKKTVIYRRTYHFEDINDNGDYVPYMFTNVAGESVDNQIIKNGDVLEAIDAPYHDGKTFKGWFIWGNGGFGSSVDFNQPISLDGVTEDQDVTVRSQYEEKYFVTFKDELGAAITSYTINGKGESFTINCDYGPYNPDEEFLGKWEVVEGNDNISPATDASGYYKNGDQVTISGDVVLVPVIANGFWLTFDANGVGATYTEPQFVKAGETPVKPSADPERPGYKFLGWFSTLEAASEVVTDASTYVGDFDFDAQLT